MLGQLLKLIDLEPRSSRAALAFAHTKSADEAVLMARCLLSRSLKFPFERCSASEGATSLQSEGPSSLILGLGDDTAMDGPGDDFIWGGQGNDTINGYAGTNLFFGGPGDDTILAANGDNTVIPGPGLDNVALGTGDDTVHIFDLCEIEAGENLDGGTGNDTLYAPVSLSELLALGLNITNFENVIVQNGSCSWNADSGLQ